MSRITSLFSILCVIFAVTAQAADTDIPAYVKAAVSDKGRPAADTARDANRKPADVVAFAGVKPGDKVMDINPGSGYFTRIFSKIVGASGKVYAMVPGETVERRPEAANGIKALAAEPAYSNTSVVTPPLVNITAAEPLDVIWTSDNYHDFKNRPDGATMAMNKSIFAALKPGGVFFVLDHAAEKGSGGRDTSTLHRVDPDLVKSEVTAAGFVLEAESDVLRNPKDDHKTGVGDSDVKGVTDQFVFRFRKPAR